MRLLKVVTPVVVIAVIVGTLIYGVKQTWGF